jgi:hypothetical protein
MSFPRFISRADRYNAGGNWRDHDDLMGVRRSIAANGEYFYEIIALYADGTWEHLDVEKVKNKEIIDAVADSE